MKEEPVAKDRAEWNYGNPDRRNLEHPIILRKEVGCLFDPQKNISWEKSGFGFVRLGLSCVVNRNRKVGANSPGATGTITKQRRPCPWWGLGRGRASREEGVGLQLPAAPAISQSWRNAPSWCYQETGETGVWACLREKGRKEWAWSNKPENCQQEGVVFLRFYAVGDFIIR